MFGKEANILSALSLITRCILAQRTKTIKGVRSHQCEGLPTPDMN